MPTYPYRDETGGMHYIYAPMRDAPPIGERRVLDGVECVRIVGAQQDRVIEDRHFTSRTLPRNWPHAKKFDGEGRPQFGSKREVDEAVARSQDSKMDAMAYE